MKLHSMVFLALLAATVPAGAATPTFTATPTSAPLPPDCAELFVSVFNTANPSLISMDSAGNLFVSSDASNDVKVYSPSGTLLDQWGGAGSGPGQFNAPYGLTVDSSDTVFVSDTYNQRIQKFSNSGTHLLSWGSAGSGPGQLNWPIGIAVRLGVVHVVDRNNHRIQKFDTNGAYLGAFGSLGSGPGQMNLPETIAIDSLGDIYIGDTGNHRIVKFDSTGAFLLSWGGNGSGPGQFNIPSSIAIDSSGRVFVSDYGNDRVQKFSPTGVYLSQFGSTGTGNGQFQGAGGSVIDAAGAIYVASKPQSRIQKFACAASSTPTPTQVVTPPGCQLCNPESVYSFNSAVLAHDSGAGDAYGTGIWTGAPGAVPVFITESSGMDVTGFIARGPRPEGSLGFAPYQFPPLGHWVSFYFQVYSGASASEMTLLDMERLGYKVKLQVYGPGHADHNKVKVTYSTATGIQTTFYNHSYGTGPYNDLGGGPSFSAGRKIVAINMTSCLLEIHPGRMNPTFAHEVLPVLSLPAYAPHASVSGDYVAFGNLGGGGGALDGYLDDIRSYVCDPYLSPTPTPALTQSSTQSPTASRTASATATLTRTPTATPSQSPASSPSSTATRTPTSVPSSTASPSPAATAAPTPRFAEGRGLVIPNNRMLGHSVQKFMLRGLLSGRTLLMICDSGGRDLVTLFDGQLSTGEHRTLAWDGKDKNGRDLPSGAYHAVLKLPDGSIQKTGFMIVR